MSQTPQTPQLTKDARFVAIGAGVTLISLLLFGLLTIEGPAGEVGFRQVIGALFGIVFVIALVRTVRRSREHPGVFREIKAWWDEYNKRDA